MSDDDWKKAGIMVRYNANSKFVEVEPEGLNALLRDQARLEWLANSGFGVLKTRTGSCISDNGNSCIYGEHNKWRDAIDEAMEGEI